MYSSSFWYVWASSEISAHLCLLVFQVILFFQTAFYIHTTIFHELFPPATEFFFEGVKTWAPTVLKLL